MSHGNPRKKTAARERRGYIPALPSPGQDAIKEQTREQGKRRRRRKTGNGYDF